MGYWCNHGTSAPIRRGGTYWAVLVAGSGLLVRAIGDGLGWSGRILPAGIRWNGANNGVIGEFVGETS